jgi:GntR family transcriptional regulator
MGITEHSLVLKVREYLLQQMMFGSLKEQDMLPAEWQLVRDLKVSRTTVRAALASLQEEGFVIKRQGVGTVINQKALRLSARLDLELELSEVLSRNGYVPKRLTLTHQVTRFPEAQAALSLAEDEDILAIEKLWTADGNPAIYVIDYLPQKIISTPYPADALSNSIFDFLNQFCNESVQYEISHLDCVRANRMIAKLLGRPVGSPVLHLKETAFSQDDIPVLFSLEYYVPGIIDFSLMRTKI